MGQNLLFYVKYVTMTYNYKGNLLLFNIKSKKQNSFFKLSYLLNENIKRICVCHVLLFVSQNTYPSPLYFEIKKLFRKKHG